MYKVRKRDGKIVSFEMEKISKAIIKAFEAEGECYDENIIDFLSLKVTAAFNSKVENNNKLPIISIDTISDVILSEYDNTIDTLIELVSNMKTKVESGSIRYDQLTCLLYSLYILEDKK